MKKSTVITIHGGDSYTSYEHYIQRLRSSEIDPYTTHPQNWRKRLQETLKDYDVIEITMPCKDNAKYQEWKIWFEKYIPYIDKHTHLVGHSLGAMFLAKYFSENQLPTPLASVHLVAGGYTRTDKSGKEIEGGGDFYASPANLKKLADVNNVIAYHSEDDPVVAFECGSFLQKHVRNVQFNSFIGRGHFLQEDFPELVDRIKSCAKKLTQTGRSD